MKRRYVDQDNESTLVEVLDLQDHPLKRPLTLRRSQQDSKRVTDEIEENQLGLDERSYLLDANDRLITKRGLHNLSALIKKFVTKRLFFLEAYGLKHDANPDVGHDEKLLEDELNATERRRPGMSLQAKSELSTLANEVERVYQCGYKPLISMIDKTVTPSQKALIRVFYEIAKLKHFQGQITGEAKYCTDAAIYCQYSISIAEDVLELFGNKIESSPYIDLSYALLTKTYRTLINICSLEPDNVVSLTIDKFSIKTLSRRDSFEAKRADIASSIYKVSDGSNRADKAYITNIKRLADDVTSFMKNYLESLFRDAQAMMGNHMLNFEYAVCGLGSMSSSQITLYSDLEFCILIHYDECQGDARSSEIKDYFRRISHLMHFMNICLGETIICPSEYDIDLSKYVRQGVNFDLGGKTPLGRPDKPYELIKTPQRMLSYIKIADEARLRIDKNLPSILEKICFVYGEKSLVDEYTLLLSDFMKAKCKAYDQLTNLQYSAFNALRNDIREIMCTSQEISYKEIQSELERLRPDFSFLRSGGVFDVKEEIYRMAEKFVNNLGKLFNISHNSHLDILEDLKHQKVINDSALVNLQRAICFVIELRFKTFDYYRCEKVAISPCYYKSEDMSKNIFTINDEYIHIEGALFEFYYSMIPLYMRLIALCDFIEKDQQIEASCIYTEVFYDNSLFNKINICFRLMQWKNVVSLCIKFSDQVGDKLDYQVVKVKSIMGIVLHEMERYPEALECQKYLLDIIRKVTSDAYFIAVCFNNAAYTCNKLGLHYEGLTYQLQALEEIKVLYKSSASSGNDSDPFLASCYANIGYTYSQLKQYPCALKYFLYALDTYHSSDHKASASIKVCRSNISYILKQVCNKQGLHSLYVELLGNNFLNERMTEILDLSNLESCGCEFEKLMIVLRNITKIFDVQLTELNLPSYRTINNIRLLGKFGIDEQFVGDAERKTGARSNVHEDLSAESTHKLPSIVEFRQEGYSAYNNISSTANHVNYPYYALDGSVILLSMSQEVLGMAETEVLGEFSNELVVMTDTCTLQETS